MDDEGSREGGCAARPMSRGQSAAAIATAEARLKGARRQFALIARACSTARNVQELGMCTKPSLLQTPRIPAAPADVLTCSRGNPSLR